MDLKKKKLNRDFELSNEPRDVRNKLFTRKNVILFATISQRFLSSSVLKLYRCMYLISWKEKTHYRQSFQLDNS